MTSHPALLPAMVFTPILRCRIKIITQWLVVAEGIPQCRIGFDFEMCKIKVLSEFPLPNKQKKFSKSKRFFIAQISLIDPQLLHSRPQRRGNNAQHFGCAFFASDAPTCLLQYSDDVAALQLLERNGNSADFESNKLHGAAFCVPTGLFLPRKHGFDKPLDIAHNNWTFKPPIHASAPQIGITKFFSILGAANQPQRLASRRESFIEEQTLKLPDHENYVPAARR